MKKYKVLLTLLLVVLVAVAAVVVTGVLDIRNAPGPDEPDTTPVPDDAVYTDVFTKNETVPLPLLKTDFENVYFTMSKSGDVRFYEIAAGALTELTEDGNYEVTATCSAQKLQAVIHYIERDGHTFGCGLFTNLLYPDVLVYDYAFFKVTDMFENYRDTNGVNYASRGAKLLLIDVDASRFYVNEKVYSEAFILNADHTTKVLLSNDQRVVGMDAKEKTDYKMFTDAILDQNAKANILFFSSRYYVDYAESGKADIFTSGGSGTNIDNVRYVIDVEGLWFWYYEGETYFFRDNGDGSFTLKAYNASTGETRNLEVFSGDLRADYFVRGAYLFNKKTGKLLNVLTGETPAVSYGAFDEGFAADLFEISENGKYCALRGRTPEGSPTLAVYNFETGAVNAFTDDVFANVAGMSLLNDGTVILSLSAGENAAAYYQLIAVR